MIFERNSLYTALADKLTVRQLIEDKICISHVVPLLGVYHCFNEINFDQLPEKFVLKCNHDSAMVCKDKNQFDFKKAERNQMEPITDELTRVLPDPYCQVWRQ
ncbi:hypothetical protein I6M78_17205 [Acinetobacter bereziniae]|nr:hypothetical protein [Acinetobacter bereziniae]